MLYKKGGMVAAAKGAASGSAGWSETGTTIGYDGRGGALKLVQVTLVGEDGVIRVGS